MNGRFPNPALANSYPAWKTAIVAVMYCLLAVGCTPLGPKAIRVNRSYRSPELANAGSQIEKGKPNKIIDTTGWIVGIPSKILLWDRRSENHKIGPETERAIGNYLHRNRLDTVKVRLNQYRPLDDMRRLTRNKSMGAPWRYTVGFFSVLGEAVVPGRVFGGDHYNPFTHTIHLYSDIPAVALHEGGHAKDFARRKWKGTYAATYALPIVPLYHESIASRDVVAYLRDYGSLADRVEANRILYPAYGTYVGSAAGTIAPGIATPLFYGSVLAGHGIGRYKSRQLRATYRHRHIDSVNPDLIPTPEIGEASKQGEAIEQGEYSEASEQGFESVPPVPTFDYYGHQFKEQQRGAIQNTAYGSRPINNTANPVQSASHAQLPSAPR